MFWPVAGLLVIGLFAGLFDEKLDLRKSSTFIGAVIGSVIVLLIWRAVAGRRR